MSQNIHYVVLSKINNNLELGMRIVNDIAYIDFLIDYHNGIIASNFLNGRISDIMNKHFTDDEINDYHTLNDNEKHWVLFNKIITQLSNNVK